MKLAPTALGAALAMLFGCLMLPLAPSAHAAQSRVAGRVIDADTQKPIENADVELANTSGGQGYHRTRTNSRGEFALENVSTERWYALTIGANGYADFVLGGWQIPSPQRTVDLVVPLDRAGVLVVKAQRTDGRPVANARVQLQSERGAAWWEGWRPPPAPRWTDAGGTARFEGLKAGFWTVTVDAEGLRTAEARRIAVRRGETTQAPVKLGKPATLSGTVTTPEGVGITGVTITARGPSEQVATSGTEGTFALGDLAAGRYRIEATHEGFEPARVPTTITLREGETKEQPAIRLTPKPPEFSFVLEREAFLPDEAPRLGVRSFRVGPIDLALYVIPQNEIVNPSGDFRRFATSADTTGLITPERWQHAPAPGPEWSWRDEQLKLPHALPPGAYLLRGRSGTIERRAIFFVTDLGVLVKRSASQVWLSAATLRGGRPVTDANVFLIRQPVPPGPQRSGRAEVPEVMEERRGARGQQKQEDLPPWPGTSWSTAVAETRRERTRTGADGTATIPQTGTATRLRLVVVSASAGMAVVDAPIASAAEQGGDQAFLYTDRPIYRPGHLVHWKLFVRKATTAGGWALPDITTANVTLQGPDGTSLPANATLSRRGSAEGTIELPKELPLGDWTLNASAGAARSSATIAVQEYRKPEFRVEVTPDREVYVNGDEVRFRIAATYFFGAPVFGANVRYNLFETRLGGDGGFDEGFGGDFDDAAPSGYGRVLKTGETRTDLDGRAEFAFLPERVPYDRRLTLEVEVTDPSNRVVNGRGTTIMGRGLFRLTVQPSVSVIAVGRPVPIDVRALDHTGKPVVASVTVELDQEAWNPLERRYTRSSRPLASQVVTTDSSGRAHVNLTPSPARAGQLIVRARAEDSKGNKITAESWAWSWDASVSNYAYRYPALEAFADRPRYAPGDTARILINTDVKDATAIVSVEGRELFETRVVPLRGNTGVVPIAIRSTWGTNVFVAVHVRRNREVHSRTLELAIDAARHDLRIAIQPNRDVARPGDSTLVALRTTDSQGRPVSAEVSLGVVDEALYSLRADATPDPHNVFYGKRPNWVTTVVSFPVLFYGGASKGEQEDVRRDFRDVAYWNPTIITDASGRAQVGFRYPDNLTEWRFTSRGMTEATQVGKAVVKTTVTKDVVARLAGPRSFVAGDEARLVSVVTNRTASPLTGVETSIEATGATLSGPKSAPAQIAARGESRAEWAVKIPEPGRDAAAPEAVFTFRARSKADTDALEVRVPVRARTVPLRLDGGGVASGASTYPVALPSDLVRAGSRVTVDVAPSHAAVALTAIEELFGYPYSCTEQTANAVIPAAAFVQAIREAKVTPPGFEDPARRLAPYLQRLASLQKPEGGWGWWPEGDVDPYMTALAIDAIAHAILAGVAPEGYDNNLDRAMSSMPILFGAARTPDGEAFVLAHLAAWMRLPNAQTRWAGVAQRLEEVALAVRSDPDRLGTAGLALATRAHADLGLATTGAPKTEYQNAAKTLLDRLMKRATTTGGLHWPNDPAHDVWWGEEIENTAYALDALLAVNPDDGRARDVVTWLVRHRTGPWWRTTSATGVVAAALARDVQAHAAELKARGRIVVSWNNTEIASREIGEAEVFGANPIRVTLEGARLRPGDNRIAVNASGGVNAYVSWTARAQVPSPGPPTRGTVSVTREYLRAERTTDRRGRPRWLTTPLATGETVRVGESVLVRLTLRSPDVLRYLVLEDPRLAGFEIDQLLPAGAEWPYATHAEARDDRAAFFIERTEAGDTVVEYLIRPEIAGRFTALPASAAGMYEPSLEARSGEAVLTVAAKP